jgi:hypothetical protein
MRLGEFGNSEEGEHVSLEAQPNDDCEDVSVNTGVCLSVKCKNSRALHQESKIPIINPKLV